MLALAQVLAQFLDPGSGPSDEGGFRVSPTLFIVIFGLGFMIAIVGHVVKSRTLVAIGILMVFVATVFVPIALHATR